MTGKLKFIAPMAAVFAIALTSSCKKSQVDTGSIALKRTTYETVVENARDILDVLTEAQKQQTTEVEKEEIWHDYEYGKKFGKYNLFNEGTQVSNIGLNVSGSVRIIYNESTPIEFNNLNSGITDTFTTSWNIEKGYVKFYDEIGGANYVIRDSENKYWRYIDHEILGKKYKTEVTDYVTKVGGFENFIMIESAKNAGYFQRTDGVSQEKEIDPENPNQIAGFGMDMSGFGGDLDLASLIFDASNDIESNNPTYPYPAKNHYLYENALLLPQLLTTEFPISFSETPKYFSGAHILDLALPILDKVLGIIDLDGLKLSHQFTKQNTDAASFQIGLENFNFKYLTDILDIVSIFTKAIPVDLVSSSGVGGIDYFVSYENNFVHQQELKLDLNNINLLVKPIYEMNRRQFYLYVDLKDFNMNGLINEEVTKGEIAMDSIDPSAYEVL